VSFGHSGLGHGCQQILSRRRHALLQ
jgi:hypothetical protein